MDGANRTWVGIDVAKATLDLHLLPRYVGHWKWILTLGVASLPLLVQAFASPDRDVRLYALLAMEQLIESGEPKRIVHPDGSEEHSWAIPTEVQSVLDVSR